MSRKYLVPLLLIFLSLSGCSSPVNESGSHTETQIPSQSSTEGYVIDNGSKSDELTGSQTTPTFTLESSRSGKTNTESKRVEEYTRSHPSNWSQRRKYDYFVSNYTTIIDGVEIESTSISPDNESLSISYIIGNDYNSTRNNTLEVIISYSSMVEIYVENEGYRSFDESWVPKHVNVTAVSPEGEVYYSGYLRYEWAYKWKISEKWEELRYDGNIRYVYEFDQTTELGPAHPDYEEDPYDK